METELPAAQPLNRGRRRRWSGRFNSPAIASDSDSSENDEDIQQEQSSQPTVQLRRSSRKKINKSLPEAVKVVNKPKKLTEKSSLKDIKNYYLDRNVKILNPSLETIFEEPQQVHNEEVIMSTRKYRRSILFKPTTVKNPGKIKKRKQKAKGVLANKKIHKKVSLEFLMDKLAEISDE